MAACSSNRDVWREFFHPVKHEGELDIHRLLTPERAVIIERRNALSRRNKIG
jgi:hypothetical protein